MGTPQTLLFFAFLAAFSVKVPMWPVHTWLPDAHVEAPTGGSVVLAAIMLKLGCYGFLRFAAIAPRCCPPLGLADHCHVDHWCHLHRPGGHGAEGHEEAGGLFVHRPHGFRDLGFFIFNELGVSGAIVQMISHGFVSGAMFLCIGVLYDRVHSREISAYGGVVNTMPTFAAFCAVVRHGQCGLPARPALWASGWSSSARSGQLLDRPALAATALIFGGRIRCGWHKRVYLAPGWPTTRPNADRHQRARVPDAGRAGHCVLWMGVYPKPFTDVMRLGHRTAQARRSEQDCSPRATQDERHELARGLPEIFCWPWAAWSPWSTFVTDPERRPTYWLTQLNSLALTALMAL